MLFSQGNAFALMDNKTEAIAGFKEALGVKGISAAEREECEKRIKALQEYSVR